MKKIIQPVLFFLALAFTACGLSSISDKAQKSDAAKIAKQRLQDSMDSLSELSMNMEKRAADSMMRIEDSLRLTEQKVRKNKWKGDPLYELYFVPVKDSIFFKDTSVNEIIYKLYRHTKRKGNYLAGIDSVNVEGDIRPTEMEFQSGINYTENGIQKYFVVLQGFITSFFTHEENKEEFLTLHKTSKGWMLAKRETINFDEDIQQFIIISSFDNSIYLNAKGTWVNPQYAVTEYSLYYQVRNDSLLALPDSSYIR